MISDATSSWRPITSSVPQGSILGTVLFNIFIDYLDDEAEYTLGKFADDTKLGGLADTPGGCAAIQKDLNRVRKWADGNLMQLNKGQCNVPQLRRNNPRHQYLLGATHLESSFAEKDLGVLMNTKLATS
ncbi:mitochondrial enolase superfamily member 1 [Grus japonensis]|uniref:Mitochondrial enolase superfamily member 1 n=1 Tax=Grus japonensis TaxID=30415 RepID=A0ABC9VRJ5_GRUJA